MSKRPFEETINTRILCIAIDSRDTYIRRAFSTEEKALEAEKKLTAKHKNLIATWVRPPSKDETIDMYYSKHEWCQTIDDDSFLIEVVDVRVMKFHIDNPTCICESAGLHRFVVRSEDSENAFLALEHLLKTKDTPDKRIKSFVIRNMVRLANDKESIETVEQVVENFIKS